MGEVISTGNRLSPVVTLVEGEDDRIVLIEQMWKYKKDLTRFILLKHGFVVTTTASGKRTKRDIIYKSDSEKSTRAVEYKPHEGDRVYSRIKVDPLYTEKDLEGLLEENSKQYHPTRNNCWHFSHEVVRALEGNTQHHPYILFLKMLYKPLLG